MFRYLFRITCIALFSLLILQGCNRKKEQNTHQSKSTGSGTDIKYAQGFIIKKLDNYTEIKVFNPWQKLKGKSLTYILCAPDDQIPDSIHFDALIRVPVRRVICMSTTHVAMIDALDELESVIGISGGQYISNPFIQERLENGVVKDVGYEQSLNYETILNLRPDLVIMYGVSGEVSTQLHRLNSLSIPVVLDAEYLEKEPLAKTEWIKFIGLFYNKLDVSVSLFNDIVQSYEDLTALTINQVTKPTVFTGLPWKNTWWVPGGSSYAAKFISDAGGTYLWEDDPGHEAMPLDIEAVYEKANQADIWINSGAVHFKSEIVLADNRLKEFKAYHTGMIFNNNAMISETGGNQYWESGVMNPHIILQDLIKIFHPDLLPDHTLVYYKKIK